MQIGQSLIYVRKVAIAGGGNLMALQKIFGEGLRALKLSSAFGWSKNRQFTSLEKINNAIDQRLLWSYYSKSNLIGSGKICQPLKVVYFDVNILDIGLRSSACIARGNKYFVYICALSGFPCQCMLTST